METFSVSQVLCEGTPSVTGDSRHKGPVMRSFGIYFIVRQIDQLDKQSSCRWFEAASRRCEATVMTHGVFQEVNSDKGDAFQGVSSAKRIYFYVYFPEPFNPHPSSDQNDKIVKIIKRAFLPKFLGESVWITFQWVFWLTILPHSFSLTP